MEMQEQYDCEVLLRKSSTIPALRLTLQGERSRC